MATKQLRPTITWPNEGPEESVKLKLTATKNPRPRETLGDFGVAINVGGPASFATAVLIQPFDPQALKGIDASSLHVFRVDARSYHPIWESGVNEAHSFLWAKINRSGTYVGIGLPKDRLLQTALYHMAIRRRLSEAPTRQLAHAITREALDPFVNLPIEDLEVLRALVTRLEVRTGPPLSPAEIPIGRGGHLRPFPLPGDISLEELRKRLEDLETPADGLPEEALFDSPDSLLDRDLPWPTRPGFDRPDEWLDERVLGRLDSDLIEWFHHHFPWFRSRDWWMYQHDRRHTGHASGWSAITSATAHSLQPLPVVSVDGPVLTKPSIVHGKIYIGSGKLGGSGGTLYKINLATGAKEGEFPAPGFAFYPYQGIGGSPAVHGGRVYFTGVHGKVYCVDAATMTPGGMPHPPALWVTDLKHADPPHKQPVNQPDADSWSGPLVVNDRVYVGCGEGESDPTYGFIFCLDADTGDVVWCFCTSKFQNRHGPGSENSPNVIPSSAAVSDPLPGWATAAGFVIQPDPIATRSTGCSVWSSCAYDAVLDRVYVGTGNSAYSSGPTSAPDKWYGSGLLSLDATTGEFKGFHQSQSDDSYWPGDVDIDVPGAPTIFSHGGVRAVAYGCKNGSCFLLDPDTMAPIARRQLLPRVGGTGLPGARGTGIPAVVPGGGTGENSFGIFGTPALHTGLGRVFVGIGGYNGMAPDPGALPDQTRVPFVRALNWNDLTDAWPTAAGADNVLRYTTTKPPMYQTSEAGLSSPAVVNDVVFVSTNKSALYALDAAMGFCLWSAKSLPSGEYVLGPAIYGNYVVIGAGNGVYIYTLSCILRRPWPWFEAIVPWWERFPWPPPPPPPPFGVPEDGPVT